MPDADIIDVFSARATPAARQARPDIFRARMAWANRAISLLPREAGEGDRAQRGGGGAPAQASPTRTCGFTLGQRVLVEVELGLILRGVLSAWIREPAQTLAVVLLDDEPRLVRCAVWRLRPLAPDPRTPAA